MKCLSCFVVCLSIFLLGAQGKFYNVTVGDELFDIFGGLVAGDVVEVNSGTYSSYSGSSWYRQYTWSGTSTSPIVIRTAPKAAVTLTGDSSYVQNILNVKGTNLQSTTKKFGSHGLRLWNSSHILVENLNVHDTGDVGISANFPGNDYDHVILRHNHVHNTGGTGEGFYLGCNNNECVMHDSIIERNLIHDTTGTSQGDGIELKTGSYGNIIRDNVIYNTHYPGITMYGTMGKEKNIVERNIIWTVGDNCIQTVGDVIVRNNIVFNCGNNGIHAKPSQGEYVNNLQILHNTVYNAGAACLKGNDWTNSAIGIEIESNAFYCPSTYAIRLVNGNGGSSSVISNNGVLGSLEGISSGTFTLGQPDSDMISVTTRNAFPTTTSKLRANVQRLTNVLADFDGWKRENQTTVGAYEYHSEGPVWIVSENFKTSGNGTNDDDNGGDNTKQSSQSGNNNGNDGDKKSEQSSSKALTSGMILLITLIISFLF